MKYEEFDALPALVREFCNYMGAVRNKSRLTVSEYALDLRTFFRFLKLRRGLCPKNAEFEEIEISDIDIDFIKSIGINDAFEFMVYCKNERGNGPASISRKNTAIRMFFKYLTLTTHKLDENPMLALDDPKQKKPLPKFLTLEQSLALLQTVDGENKERDYCIITLFLNCGLRLAELVGINLGDISDDNTLTVIGKGGKQRMVYLNGSCVSAVKSYLAVRPREGVAAKDKNALFLSRLKKRISPKTVQHIVYEFIDKAGLAGRGYSAHKLRHTAATLMYRTGSVDVLVLKELLGHENLNTTQIYTHVASSQMEEAVKANPLADVKNLKDK